MTLHSTPGKFIHAPYPAKRPYDDGAAPFISPPPEDVCARDHTIETAEADKLERQMEYDAAVANGASTPTRRRSVGGAAARVWSRYAGGGGGVPFPRKWQSACYRSWGEHASSSGKHTETATFGNWLLRGTMA